MLAHVLTKLNKKYNYQLNLFLLSIDEGISGYRDDSLECVKQNQIEYDIPLHIVSYNELYGWTMDQIVAQIGQTNNCTYCGVFRRQALDRGAVYCKANKLVTGHNADDMAETVLMNILRGDINRLGRTVDITTGNDHTCSTEINDTDSFPQLPRCKPFKYTYEKEIVLYAYHMKLLYFSTECIYSPFAYRGYVREYIKQLERMKPAAIIDIITSAEQFNVIINITSKSSYSKLGTCSVCGYLASNRVCKACTLMEGLRRGKARIQIQQEQLAHSVQHEDAATVINSMNITSKNAAMHVHDW